MKALQEQAQVAADKEQARLDRETFLEQERRDREEETRRRQVGCSDDVTNQMFVPRSAASLYLPLAKTEEVGNFCAPVV